MGAYRNSVETDDKSLGMVSDLEPYLTAMLTGALFGTQNNVLFNCKILVTVVVYYYYYYYYY